MPDVSEAAINSALLSALNRVTGKGYSAVPFQMPAAEVGLDSLGLSQVILHLEETIGCEIDDRVLIKLIEAETIGEFQVALLEQLAERPAAFGS